MDRRSFVRRLGGGVSGSFVAGAIGGLGAGKAVADGIEASRPWSRRSHSQQGEDLVVDSICEGLGISAPKYLDVGAADPIHFNNTYFFYEKGCRGVLVEPNPAFCRKLRAARPGDAVMNVGIGVDGRREADYYMIDGLDYLNTFSKEQADDYVAKAGGRKIIAKVVKMPLVDINAIIRDHFRGAPDFLSLDTEGLDLDILKTLDLDRFRPAVLCVETLGFGTARVVTGIFDLLRSKGYEPRGGTFVNTVFVDGRRPAP